MATFCQTPFTLLSICIVLLPASVAAINVTVVFSHYPDLSAFADLLSDPTIAGNLANRTSITILAVSNSIFSGLLPPPSSNSKRVRSALLFILRYHILLECFSPTDLCRIPASGRIVVTLLQTTGRANLNYGDVNLTRNDDGSITARSISPLSASSANFLSLVDSSPYNLSIFTVDSLLLPHGFALAASESTADAPVNITRALQDGKNFNIVLAMLFASGVIDELEEDEGGAGLTIFAPTDDAFTELPPQQNLQHLSAANKSVILQLHVLRSYYPLGSLQSIVNPVQPTIATEAMGAGLYTLNITRVNGSVAIDTGIVQAEITQTVFDQNPVAVFGISKVLLPKEMFGHLAERSGSYTPPPDLAPQHSIQDPSSLPPVAPTRSANLRSSSDNVGGGELLPLAFSVLFYLLI